MGAICSKEEIDRPRSDPSAWDAYIPNYGEGNPYYEPLLPPTYGLTYTDFSPSAPPYPEDSHTDSSATTSPSSTYDRLLCQICFVNSKDTAFGCGHLTCEECAEGLRVCPICRSPIQTKTKLYF